MTPLEVRKFTKRQQQLNYEHEDHAWPCHKGTQAVSIRGRQTRSAPGAQNIYDSTSRNMNVARTTCTRHHTTALHYKTSLNIAFYNTCCPQGKAIQICRSRTQRTVQTTCQNLSRRVVSRAILYKGKIGQGATKRASCILAS